MVRDVLDDVLDDVGTAVHLVEDLEQVIVTVHPSPPAFRVCA
ncbi:hypothetical protein [Salinibacter ruber]|nr:hypothetical protein [Salinibacter ruber]MCS4119641.1 uncharacterized protein (DUF1800 family) [Salinibacter ruber]